MTDDKLARKVKDFYESGLKEDQNWRARAKEARQFYLGNQWNSEDLKKLNVEGRPALTINRILPTINLLSGIQRQNRHDIKVLPRTAAAGNVAEVLTAICKHAMDVSNAEWHLSAAFMDGIVTGKGWITFDIDYSADPLHGDLIIEKVNPFHMIEDREAEQYDLNKQARFLIRQSWWSLDDLKLFYPSKARTLAGSLKGPGDDDQTLSTVEGDQEASRSTTDVAGEEAIRKYREHKVLECWWKERKRISWFVNRRSGQNYRFTPTASADKEQTSAILDLWFTYRQSGQVDMFVEQFVNRYGTIPADLAVLVMQEQGDDWRTVERPGNILHRTLVTGDIVLEDREDPFSGLLKFPFVRFCPYHMDDNLMGVVDNLIGAQEELNKRRSQALHHMNITANSGYIGDDDALTNERWDDLKDFGSKPGVNIRKKPGAFLQRIEPARISEGHLILAEAAANDIKDISGANTDLMGGTPEKSESGRAMLFRQRQGLVVNEILFDNWRQTLQLFGETLVELVRSGRSDERSLIYSDQEIAAIVEESKLDIDPNEIRSFRTGRYTVKVSPSPNVPTVRMANFEMLLEAFKAGVPIPYELIIDASDLPEKERIMAALVRKQQMMEQMGLIDGAPGAQAGGKAPARPGAARGRPKEPVSGPGPQQIGLAI